ncbi:MAG: C1 family peptidase [Methanomassiliicoccales archaeon]|jgi:C1A family cysteine protease
MKHGTLAVFVWTLVLITLSSGLNLTQVSGLSTRSAADAADAQISQQISNATGTGSINYHLATEADIQLMKEQLTDNANSDTPVGDSFSNIYNATGLSVSTDAQLESLVGKIVIFDSYDNLPLAPSSSTYDISTQPYFPQVRDQGSEGSCAAFSTIYYNYGYLEALNNGWTDAYLGNNEHLMSPSWAYNKVVLQEDGSTIADEALVGKTIGIATWNMMPYAATDHMSWGSEAAWRNAPTHRIDNIVSYVYGQSTIQDIKDSLVSNHPVTIALNAAAINGARTAFADGNFILSSSEYAAYDTSTTDHAVTIVGYDDGLTDDGDSGAFKVVNSWGTSFGNGGYFWMTYKTIREIGGLLEATSLTDKVDYQPSDLAVYHFDDSPTYDAGITFSAVRNSDNQIMAQISPYFSSTSYAFMPTFMCQDISELSAYLMDPHYSIEMTVHRSHLAGSISSYRIEVCHNPYVDGKAMAISPEAPGLPLKTPATASTQLPAEPIVSPSEALSYFDGALTFAGETQWVGVRDVQGRPHAMQSGDVGDSSNSTLIAVVEGPGTFSFDWKVSSEPNFDYLNFYLDGNLNKRITNETSWATVTTAITSGIHYLNWTYSKDVGVSFGNDSGWIDNVAWNGRSSVLFMDFEPYGTNAWYGGDNNSVSGVDYWGNSTLKPRTGTHSLWCAEFGIGANGLPNHMNRTYDQNMEAYALVPLPDLTGIGTARLSFEYWAYTGTTDHAYVQFFNGFAWTTNWTQPSVNSNGWQLAEMAIPAGTEEIAFRFTSGATGGVGHAGVFIDDVMVTVSDPSTPSSWLSSLSMYTTTQTVNLTCTANDIGGSGVAYVQLFYRKGTTGSYSAYVTDSNPSGLWAPGMIYFDPTAPGSDGFYQFYSVATDRAGNVETAPTIADASTTLDRAAPVTTASNTGTASPGWNTGSVTITLAANDVTSGVSATSYRIDSGAWSPYSVPFTISTQGIHTVQYSSTDIAGNIESAKTLTVQIDGQAPVSSVSLNGVVGNGPWYVTNVGVNILVSDLSGVQEIEYRLNGAGWLTYAGTVWITDQGNFTLEYAATDLAGNREITKTMTIKIDSQDPVTTGTITGQGNTDQMRFSGTVSINLSALDAVSGISSTQYALDGGAWTPYPGTITVGTVGDHVIRYRSTDQAGNVEQPTEVSFTIDLTAPTSSAALIGTTGTAGWYVSNVTVDLNITDQGSGVGQTTYRLDGSEGGAWTAYSGNLTVTSEGDHTLEYRSTDQAGNADPIGFVNFSIDRTVPRSEVSLSGSQGMNGWYIGTVTVTVTANDSVSGVQVIRCSLDGGDWTDVTSPMTISADGNHTLEYYSVDEAGNAEAVRSVSVRLDSVMPTASFSLDNGITVHTTSLRAVVIANDSGSGIAKMEYKIDDGSYAPCIGDMIALSGLSDGRHTLILEVTDEAGHTTVKELDFTVDTGTVSVSSEVLLLAGIAIAIVAIGAVLLLRRSKR